MYEKTLVIIKPDGMQRQLVGRIIQRFEGANLTLEAAKMEQLSDELLYEHYQHLVDRPFFPTLLSYMKEVPVLLLIVEGPDAIARVRHLVGATNPLEAAAGTIRGDFGTSQTRNVVHASDSMEAAQTELARFFKE